MKYLTQILVIFLFSFLGELLHHWIPLPIPASIYGMVLLFLALKLKLLKLSQVKGAGSFLVGILPVLFVAPVVSLLDCWQVLRSALFPICLILVVTTVLCFAVSGRVTQALMKKGGTQNG